MLTINKKENFQKEKTGGRVDPPSPAGINRHPSKNFIHAKLGEIEPGILEKDFQDILEGTDYPNIHLLRYLTRNNDFGGYEDWINYFIKNYDLTTKEAYEKVEGIALEYFGVERYSSYDSYDKTHREYLKGKKWKSLP